jgi:hypothetical protein
MFTILSHKENTDQNYTVSILSYINWQSSRKQTAKNSGKGVGEKEP